MSDLNFNQTNRKGLTKEQLHDVDLAEDTQRPAGRYVVEMADSRTGRQQQRVSENNYITPLYDRIVRWYQGGFFNRKLRFIHQSAATQQFPSSLFFGGDRPPYSPIECMVGTDSSIPEDEDSSWATGLVQGWGVRWKGTVPATGPRGQINEAQSEIGINTTKLVWDFNENQGNGDYSSLAIARIQHPTNYNLGVGPTGVDNRTYPVIGLPGQWPKYTVPDPNPGVASRQIQGKIVGMDDSYIYILGHRTSTVSTLRIYRVPLAGYTGNAYVPTPPAIEAVTSGDLASLSTNTTSSDTGANTMYTEVGPHIAFYGSNILMAWPDYDGSLRMGQWTTAGARVGSDLVVSATNPASPENGGAGNYTAGLAVIGTKAYVTGRGHSNIYRVELTTMTVDATIPLPLSAVAQAGLCSDGTNLFVMTYKGILKVQPDGTYIDCYGHPFSKSWFDTGQTPWSTTSAGQRMQGPWEREIEQAYLESTSYDRMTGGASLYDYLGSPAYSLGDYSDTVNFRHHLYMSSGILYGGSRINDPTATSSAVFPAAGLYPLVGQNCISRKVLDSPVTKTTSSTMKWTYSLTLPSSWSAIPVPVAPPS